MALDGTRPSVPILYKIVIVGDLCVGKTSLLQRYCEDKFDIDVNSTVGIDYKCKMLRLHKQEYNLQLWDTAGQERFRTLTKAFYRGATGVLILYDITQQKSFDNTLRWIENVRDNAPTNVTIIIVGCKCDLVEEREVESNLGLELSKSIEAEFIECSSLTGHNICEVFSLLLKEVMNNQQTDNRANPRHYLDIYNKGSTSKCCL